jgi:hypothetical protein
MPALPAAEPALAAAAVALAPAVMLVYNDKPIRDYFRRVTDETVIGLTPAEITGTEFFFQLTRDRTTQVVP